MNILNALSSGKRGLLRLAWIGIVVVVGGSDIGGTAGTGVVFAQPPSPILPLSANDVSWLFPMPTRAADFDNLISMRDLTTQNPHDPTKRDPAWPASAFQRFLDIATSPMAQVGGNQISLPAEAQSMGAWFIAGIRIDAGAPGLSPAILQQFGQSPQIRLIVQPVTRAADGSPVVQDIAGHLVFGLTAEASNPAQAGCSARPTPDLVALNAIIRELDALRTKLNSGQLGTNRVPTSGVPLGVHPGLLDPTTANRVRQEMNSFLERHAFGRNLDAMAITGPAPWVFLAMQKVPPNFPAFPSGGFVPVPGPTLDGQQFAQMLGRVEDVPRVVPAPHTNNLNPITCENAAISPASIPVANRSGSSTAELFVSPTPPADKSREILDLIGDPTKSHFFNTDCVSCHTETTLAVGLLQLGADPRIDPRALPKDPWNVRNFGWSPFGGATVTRRTAAETDAVVKFINSNLLTKLRE